MSLGTNGASAAQLDDPKAPNEFIEGSVATQATEEAAAAQKAQDIADGQMMGERL